MIIVLQPAFDREPLSQSLRPVLANSNIECSLMNTLPCGLIVGFNSQASYQATVNNKEEQKIEEPKTDPESLLFETSPYGNLDAIVEHDGRAVFFYLSSQGREGAKFGTRACWVRNLIAGPLVFNKKEMEKGLPPILPKTYCKHSDGQPLPQTDDLEIVWFEEGNGAALCEQAGQGESKILAVIPPWSGANGFHGYAAECATENPVCWPMPGNPKLNRRIEQARIFWRACSSTKNHPFQSLQANTLQTYENVFGQHSNYYAIDGSAFPPRGLAVYENEDQFVALTVGMSLCPQPTVELAVEDPANFRRVELGLHLSGVVQPEASQQLVQQLSGLAAMPWRNLTWLGPNHTCGFDTLTQVLGDEFKNVRFERMKSLPGGKQVNLESFRGDPVHVLWLEPFAGEPQG